MGCRGTKIEERFDIFGGCARIVLEEDEHLVKMDRKRLEAALNSADALSTLEVSSEMRAISQDKKLPKIKLRAGKYYQPTSKTFPAFDAWTQASKVAVEVCAGEGGLFGRALG
ncbi:Pyridoxal 4-dehydrogenase [Durusdinium trenchii]|uniref:Pyridoxal 4-dehydrogenase n=1 Tax=Durusdinium trenchii TaxID=1381693 RepID=A0ABP0PH51_9DINO